MKRFYTNVTVEPAEGGWRAALDGRGIRTAGGKPQIVPTRALAEALAGEWAAQGDKIDAAAFPLRDLADLALDVVAGDRAEAVRAILAYAETDTLCYRADPDEPLYHRQQEMWEPLLKGIESRHAVRFARISGIIHRPQPPETLAALRALLETMDDYTLAALRLLASLAASLSVGLAALADDADAEELWRAANCEEDWQAELWGWDTLAAERRAERLTAFTRAMEFARLSGKTP